MEAEWRNATEVLRDIQVPLDQVTRKGAEMIARDARARVPEDTGTLKREIDIKESQFKGGGWIVEAQGSGNYDKFYASFVEFGTHKEQHQAAQPYMRPSVKRNRPKIQDMWQRALNE